MRLNFKNQSGIALLMVLSAITALTVAVVELRYASQINYKLAINHKNRLQAEYLAKSAINFSKILIKYEKQAQKTKQDVKDDVGNINVEPIYKLFPLSTETLKGVFSGAFSDFLGGGEEGESEEESEIVDEAESSSESEIEAGLNAFDKEAAQKFLDFEGDFYSEITEEQNKYDLNRVYRVVTSSKDYDNRKKLLHSILQLPKFEKIFEEKKVLPAELANALGDWVDENEVINQFDNVQRGSEKTDYSDSDYEVKNAKFLTLSEMRLIHNMDDQIYDLLSPLVSVFNTTDQINACLADEDLSKAIIHHYTNHADCTNGVSYDEQDEDQMMKLVGELLSGCPDPKAMAKAVNTSLGLEDLGSSSKRRRGRKKKNTGVPGCKFQLVDLLTDKNEVFNIRATGMVGDTSVNIRVVLNASDRSPVKWNYMYYKVE